MILVSTMHQELPETRDGAAYRATGRKIAGCRLLKGILTRVEV